MFFFSFVLFFSGGGTVLGCHANNGVRFKLVVVLRLLANIRMTAGRSPGVGCGSLSLSLWRQLGRRQAVSPWRCLHLFGELLVCFTVEARELGTVCPSLY